MYLKNPDGLTVQLRSVDQCTLLILNDSVGVPLVETVSNPPTHQCPAVFCDHNSLKVLHNTGKLTLEGIAKTKPVANIGASIFRKMVIIAAPGFVFV